MKKQVLLRWFWCTMEYLMIFPAIVILTSFSLSHYATVIFVATLPLHLFIGILITYIMKRFRRIIAVLVGAAYVIIITLVLMLTLLTGRIGEIIIVTAGVSFFYYWGVRAGIGDTKTIFFYSIGLIIHAVSLFIISQLESLRTILPIVIMISIIYCIIGLPLANRRFLINETHEKNSLKIVPGTVLRGNKIIVTIALAGIIILSFWNTLMEVFLYIAESISWIIGKIFEFLGSVFSSSEGNGAPGGGGMDQLPPAEENPIVSTILDIIALLLFALILFFIIRYLIKNYKRIYKSLYNLLSALFNRLNRWSSTEQGYFDSEESLLKSEIPKRQSFIKRLFKREPRWRDMKDNSSRVRFIYSRFVIDHIRKGFRFKLSDTPSEVVEQIQTYDKHEENEHTVLGNVYNEVRYGAKTVDDETVSTLKKKYL